VVDFEENVSLSKFCTIRIGGIAKRLYFPRNVDDVIFLQKKAQDENKRFIPIGIGSNIIFKDGLRDEIFFSTYYLKGLNIIDNNGNVFIEAEAGVSFKQIVSIVKKFNLEGFENLSGIPATVGGAVVMNAGAFGSETFDILEKVFWIDREGNLIVSDKSQIKYGYRWTQFQNEGFVYKAVFKLNKSDKNIAEIIKKHLIDRNRKQPLNLPTGGSTFKNVSLDKNYLKSNSLKESLKIFNFKSNNIEKDLKILLPAGYLLDKSGLKGYRIGDVGFSEKHANFTVNYGNGKFSDFERLINTAKEKVKSNFGIELKLEMKII